MTHDNPQFDPDDYLPSSEDMEETQWDSVNLPPASGKSQYLGRWYSLIQASMNQPSKVSPYQSNVPANPPASFSWQRGGSLNPASWLAAQGASTAATPIYRLLPDLQAQAPSLPTDQREMPVIGYRAWGVTQTDRNDPLSRRLGSTAADYAWVAGVNTARCDPIQLEVHQLPRHLSPGRHCTCGLHVVNDLDSVPALAGTERESPFVIVGAVMGWGRVIQHGYQGWRAQYARILALLEPHPELYSGIVDSLREYYGVPILKRSALELMVKEYGDPLPGEPA